jgi:hypothetical protein
MPSRRPVVSVLVDSGYFSEAAVRQVEQTAADTPPGTVVYAPLDKTSHHRSAAGLEKRPEPETPPPKANSGEKMRHRLKTAAGKSLYKLRQQTVEPVFGINKSAMGFRQFLLRGTAKVSTEWTLGCLAYNMRRLHTSIWRQNRRNRPKSRPIQRRAVRPPAARPRFFAARRGI